MDKSRRTTMKLAGMALALSGLWGPASAHEDDDWLRTGKVFTSTNAPNNELLVYTQSENGALSLVSRAATLGQGTGAGLGSQGAVTLSSDGRYLFVVNALSNTLSTFSLRGKDLHLSSVTDSGGLGPISVTERNGLVFVLNNQGAGNIAGFKNERGTLTPIKGATAALSAAGGTNPAQIGFSHDGDTLVVTEKGTNRILSYRVRGDGRVSAPTVNPSSGTTPFGFAFDRRDHLIVSEAFGGAANASAASSYALIDGRSPRLEVLSASIATSQSAACWVVITPNGRYAYTTNAGSGSLSSFNISPVSGKLNLAQAVAGSIGATGTPIDAAISSDGRSLYVLGARALGVTSFQIQRDGALLPGSFVGGLPTGSVGLAAN